MNDAHEIPVLDGEAADAVAFRGGHVQIIAAAGSGKTEVVSQRVAALLAEGEDPASIVAFTFTEKAAAELKERIRQRVTALVGDDASDRLGQLFVGTIHAYCFRLLQTHVPAYETYTPLDENQLANLLSREANRLQLKRLHPRGQKFASIDLFRKSVDVVENELLEVADLPDGDFKEILERYYAMLDGYRFMSFGTQIVRAVQQLQVPAVHAKVTAGLRHLIVDEYQDVNPAQEQLIQLLSKPHGNADLVVVGDDDQAIYQWRGSNVSNIVTFDQRYHGVAQFRLLTNRRSRPAIVELANQFAQTIPERLPKEMGLHREAVGSSVAIGLDFDDEAAEADALARTITVLAQEGVPYRDIAVLVRGKVAYSALLDAFDAHGVPVQPGGRTGLFLQPEAEVLGATFAWLADVDWSPQRFASRARPTLDQLLDKYKKVFGISAARVARLRPHLTAWKAKTSEKDFSVTLVGELYELLGLLGLNTWDTSDSITRNRLGTIARFSTILADYEMVTRRARRDADNPGEQVAGEIGGEWFYKNFAILLSNYANGSYDDFDGEQDVGADGVALGTVHGAKGLEWPLVFLPSLTARRFPSSRTGRAEPWLLPRELFDAARYEGSDADERRLFYVALTRARDWVSLSNHARVNAGSKQTSRPSPYLLEAQAYADAGGHPTGAVPVGLETPDLTITYSALDAYLECPQSYLLRSELGFMPPLRTEIGYGNAVHHIMRLVAEHTQRAGAVPSSTKLDGILSSEFFLPFANKAAHKEMRAKAQRLVQRYITDYSDDLMRTWATERPFELYLPGVVVTGRADVVYDDHDGVPHNLAIVDYKTSTRGSVKPLQLQVYADAGRREGLTVGGAFIHDLQTATRHRVAITEPEVAAAEAVVIAAADSLSRRDFTPSPERTKCRNCDVRAVCGAARLS